MLAVQDDAPLTAIPWPSIAAGQGHSGFDSGRQESSRPEAGSPHEDTPQDTVQSLAMQEGAVAGLAAACVHLCEPGTSQGGREATHPPGAYAATGMLWPPCSALALVPGLKAAQLRSRECLSDEPVGPVVYFGYRYRYTAVTMHVRLSAQAGLLHSIHDVPPQSPSLPLRCSPSAVLAP